MNMYRVGTLLCAALFFGAISQAAFVLDFEQGEATLLPPSLDRWI